MIPPPPLSVSLAGLAKEQARPWSSGGRAAIEWAVACGFRLLHLDATAPDLRPRDLDRSARRDIAALLRRSAVRCSGVDLLIPEADFADPAKAERATTAAAQAIEWAADLVSLGAADSPGRVFLTLPAETPGPVVDRIRERAAVCGVRVADLAGQPRQREPGDPVGVGLDPAAILLTGGDPARAASRADRALAGARASDADQTGRVPLGAGRLDRLEYQVALATAGYTAPVVLDLRGLPDQDRAARRALAFWTDG